MEGWADICINNTHFESAIASPRWAMQNMMTSYMSARNKEVVLNSNRPIDISMLSTPIASKEQNSNRTNFENTTTLPK